MGSLDSTETLVSYMKTTDCSQGFCSSYCPQWCYVVFPPPPFEFLDENSSQSFSPLVIVIIGILASAFLLLSYYAIISKFCGSMDSTRRDIHNYPSVESEGNYDPSNHEPWHVSSDGLDEVMIKSITVFKYKSGDGLTEGTDCSVCLNEFEESENLRLLPKCSHAFHGKCIDTWLRSHSNCPLCRASVVQPSTFTIQPPLPVPEAPMNHGIYFRGHRDQTGIVEADVGEEALTQADEIPKTLTSADRDHLGNPADGDTVIEIGEIEYQRIRRSVSMSNLCHARVSIADVICMDQDEEDGEFMSQDAESSKKPIAEMSTISHRNQIFHSVTTYKS